MDSTLEQKLQELPRKPGVYFHKSSAGEVLYVGKAAVLRNRVRQYFQDSRGHDNKTLALVQEIADVDWIETESEIDALFLESEMVKRYMPRYNVLLRDDKSQSFVRITMKHEWPTVGVTRAPLDDGADYIGPFYNAYALKKALRYLRRVFPYFVREPKMTDSKLEQQIGLNPNRALGSDAYKANLRTLMSYIRGNRKQIVRELEADMKRAATAQEFEKAAKLRNKLYALQELQRRVMFGDREFLDISKDKALGDLAELFGLAQPPKRIEGYDISHMSGKEVVASMVVFTNGASDRSEYRKFAMKTQQNNDVGNMRETLLRRFNGNNRKSWGAPDLLLIDGGNAQLDAALDALREREVNVPCISIAKREEEMIIDCARSGVDCEKLRQLVQHEPSVFVETRGTHMIVNLHAQQRNASSHSKNLRASTAVNRYDDIVKLFQRIRDESHRFAVSYHTVLKRQRQTASALEDISGVGSATRKKLIKTFGSMRGVMQASEADLANVVGKVKARNIYSALQNHK